MVLTASPTLMAADICRTVMIIDVNTPNRAGLMAICVPKDSKLSAFAVPPACCHWPDRDPWPFPAEAAVQSAP